MTTTQIYNELAAETFKRVLDLSKVKGEEYAGEVDRLNNFRRNAAMWGVELEQCWGVYAGKHWDALAQYIRDMADGKERTRSEPLESRVDDLIVYLLLFKCMLRERQPQFGGFAMPRADLGDEE